MKTREYRIIEDKNSLCPYAVFENMEYTTGCRFWQQCSRWYFRRGWAVRKLMSMIKRD